MTTPLVAVRHRPARILVPPRRLMLSDLPACVGTFAAAIGLIVLLGWVVDSDVLKTILPAGQEMKANTAICIVLLGAGLVLVSRAAVGSSGRRVGLAFVGAATAITVVTASQYLIHGDLGIDELLFRDAFGTVFPGRMSPLAAICLILLGLATIIAALETWRRLVFIFAGTAIVLAALSVFVYIFDAAAPAFLRGTTEIALDTSVAIGILGIGVIGLLGAASPFVPLAGRSATARLVRQLLAISVVVPVVIGSLRLEGQRLGLYDTAYGTSLMVVGTMALMVIGILHSARWASDLEAKRDASELERDRFFELSLDMLSVVGTDGRLRRVNRAWGSTLGYPAGELVGRRILDLVHPDDLERTVAESTGTDERARPSVHFQSRFRHRDGEYRWLEWSQTPTDGSVAFAAARDVTDRKHEEERRARQQHALETQNKTLSKRTLHDGLTGLENRRSFDATVARLEQRWSRLPDHQRPPVSIVIFDLDHFGKVNKQHGHQAGDAVLRLFAGILKMRFRDSDLVARYGGEEFVAVLQGATSADAIRIAEGIRVVFEGASIDIGTGTPIRVTVSAGCAQLGEEMNVSAGLSQADVWLSQAKRTGRNQVVGL